MSEGLPGNVAMEVLDTLKAILTQLQILNNYSSQVELPADNLHKILQAGKSKSTSKIYRY